MPTKNIQKTSQSRVFTIEDRAGPNHAPDYQTLARATSLSWAQGDVTPVRTPDPKQYGRYIVIDKIRGQQDLPGLGLEFRLTRDASDLLKLTRKGCAIDLHVHVGSCKDPSDFDGGWEKIMVLESAAITNYATDDLGNFDADGEAPVMEMVDLVGDDFYEIVPIAFTQKASSEIVQEIVDVTICDARSCGECGLPSDGCQKVFALTASAAGSPGLPAEVVFTQDGGATWGDTNISTLAANEDPTAIACVGPYIVVISDESNSLHYADTSDILDGVEAWVEVATGFVSTKLPNAIFSTGRTATWIAADGGYIYFTEDPTTSVTPQTSGDLTTDDLGAIHGIDDDNIVAVGANNAILLTRNGGQVWSLVTGPSAQAAVTINAVAMLSENEWYIGYNDGSLYYTINGGVSWVEKTIPGSLTSITDIVFATRTVGYISGNAAGPAGKILRTVSGGYSWYVAPETAGLTIPTNGGLNAIAACGDDPNQVWTGGLASGGIDGILLKGA